MKKLMVLAAAVCALAGLGVSSSVASADNGAQTTHFSVAYGPFTCSGERIVKTGPNAFVKDSETCLDSAVGDVAPGTYNLGPNEWWSDYEYFVLNPSSIRPDTSATIIVTLNSDGTTTWNIVAYYAP